MHQSQQDEVAAIADWVIDLFRSLARRFRKAIRPVSDERYAEQAGEQR